VIACDMTLSEIVDLDVVGSNPITRPSFSRDREGRLSLIQA
jgi:hypothetical protein